MSLFQLYAFAHCVCMCKNIATIFSQTIYWNAEIAASQQILTCSIYWLLNWGENRFEYVIQLIEVYDHRSLHTILYKTYISQQYWHYVFEDCFSYKDFFFFSVFISNDSVFLCVKLNCIPNSIIYEMKKENIFFTHTSETELFLAIQHNSTLCQDFKYPSNYSSIWNCF